MYGLSDDEIAAISEGKFAHFVPAEASLLRMADALADTPSNVSDELYRDLRNYFSEAELMALLARSSIYIATSIYEPFGIAPLEAALCGCAVIANGIPTKIKVMTAIELEKRLLISVRNPTAWRPFC